MATQPNDSERTPNSGRELLPPKIEERIVKIRRRWAKLRVEWNSDELIEIHSALSELSEYSAHEGLHSLADAAFSAEVYLSSFVGTQIPMTPNQRESADSLLAELTAGHRLASGKNGKRTAPVSSDEIFLLGPVEGPLHAVAELIRSQGLREATLQDVNEIESEMQKTLPAMIVTDIHSIPEIETLLEHLAHLRKSDGTHIPIIYVSDTDSLEMRIKAIRAGGEAFFAPPYDVERLVRRLKALKNQEESSHKRILIVEDDTAQADFSASILTKAGFETSIVTDPMQTLDRLKEFAPDLIIMDIYMPEVDGIELTSVIREYNEYARIPIIFLSGEQDTERQVDALSVGGDDFVTKPIRPKHLIAIVKNRIRRSLLLRERQAVSVGFDLLGKNQFVERLTTLLSTDPMRAKSTSLLLISPDSLEPLQQQLGTQSFDQFMIDLAQLVKSQLGDRDAIGRLDPHTLAIASRRPESSDILDLSARLHEAIVAHNFHARDANHSITAGIGIAFAGTQDKDANNLLSRVHTALERAQREARSQTVVFDEDAGKGGSPEQPGSQQEENLAGTIRSCLDEDGFVVLFQPLLDLQERGSENYEITLRIPTANGELLTPDEFQPAAEQAGLMQQVDKWLVVHALEKLKERRTSAAETRFFLNQSEAALIDPEFPEWLAQELRGHQVVGTGLVLDLPLSSLSHDLKAAKKLLGALHRMDIAVCISQFPEKSAAFKVLQYIDGDYIRIAKRLLKSDRQTIMSVVNQAHNAKAKVIISHIDDPKSIDLHWSSGGDLLQGDFIQPPIDNLDYDFSQVVI